MKEESIGAFLVRFLIVVFMFSWIVFRAAAISEWCYDKSLPFWQARYPASTSVIIRSAPNRITFKNNVVTYTITKDNWRIK